MLSKCIRRNFFPSRAKEAKKQKKKLRLISGYTHAGFRNEDAENESVPYPAVQEEAPDSNPDGRALEAEPDGLEVKDLR